MTAPTDTVGWTPLSEDVFTENESDESLFEIDFRPNRVDKEAPGVKLKPRCIRRGHAGHRH